MIEHGNYDNKKYGYVFNIQNYSVHDGPGIRTLVFLKGCPLKCKWCCNPESQRRLPELAFNSNKCIGLDECGKCLETCATGAVKKDAENKIAIDRTKCDNCLRCADACPSKALNVFGKLLSVNEVLDAVEKDGIFYSRSGGGMTLSGGEPLLQPDFAAELLKEAKHRKINTTMETCGYADWESLEKVCAYLDYIYYDIKCINPHKHAQFTGVTNELILENFEKLCTGFPHIPVRVRTPVIPCFNDTEDDIRAVVNLVRKHHHVTCELLAYHRLGEPKYAYLGRKYPFSGVETVNEKHMAVLKEIARLEFHKWS